MFYVAACILLFVCNVLAGIVAGYLAQRWINRRIASLEISLNDELTKLVQGEACRSATVLNAVGTMIGSAAGKSAKASLMADLSHAKRLENNATNEAQLALLDDHTPGLGSAVAGLGANRVNKLMKNPLLQLAMSAFMRGGNSSGNGGSTSGSDVANRLRNMH